jgi:hypothetical protein
MNDVHLLRCISTHYRIRLNAVTAPKGELLETKRNETTGYHIRDSGSYEIVEPYIFLHNSGASAPLSALFTKAREGRGWTAQAGAPPVYVSGEGWVGRNNPNIYVPADSLLELEQVLKAQEKAA